MAENESLKMALEHYRQRKLSKLKEVQELDLMISRLSRDLGETSQETQAAKEEDSSDTGISNAWQENEFGPIATFANGARANVRPDEFFGMTYSTAAAAYLDKVRHAVSMDELLDALNRGGCPVGGREPRKTLYISLIRDVRTFVPIPGSPGFLGLRKFYPNLKALKEKEPKARNARGRLHKKRRNKANVEEMTPKGKPQTLCSRGCGKAPHRGSCAKSSVKEKSHPATDQTAQKEAKATM
jgi:hypothetical protein